MTYQIKRFSIHQTSKVVALLYFIFALASIPFMFLADTLSPPEGRLGTWTILVIGLILVVFGYLWTAIRCAIYNGIAKHFGGVKFTLEES